MFNRCESCQKLHHHHQPHPIHTQLLPSWWFSLRTAPPSGGVVAHGGLWRSGYAIPLLQEFWGVSGSWIIGVDHAKDPSITSNHTSDVLIYHHGFRVQLKTCPTTMWYNGRRIIKILLLFQELLQCWFFRSSLKSVPPPSCDVVVQWGRCRSELAIPLMQENWVVHHTYPRGDGSCQRPYHHLQPYPRHAQLSPPSSVIT